MASELPGLTTADGRRPRVAIVDGNHSSAMVTEMLVHQFGCAAFKASTGEAALALIREHAGIDLVVIDLAIRDMDAIVIAQLIRAHGPRGTMPILALSERGQEIPGGRSRAAGFSATLKKPYSPRELFGVMQAVLTRSSLEIFGSA